MAIETAKRDPNYVTTLMGVDMTTGLLPTKVYVDETTHRLLVNAVISGGGASDGAIVDGGGSGLKATVLQSTATPAAYGLVILNPDGSNISGGGGGSGTQYAEGATAATATGTVAMGKDGTTIRAFIANSSGEQIIQAKQNGTWNIGTLTAITNVVHIDDNSGSLTVDNGGTFVVQATLAAETTKVIGTVNQGTSPWIMAGGGTAGSAATGVMTIQGIASMTPVQVSQATASNLNATVVGTGTFVVQATLAAETTKVIGTVRTADGAGNLFTTNSTTFTAKFAQDVNLLGVLGTAFTTVGKVDVKGADGDVFVRQTTAANLNATVVGTGTFVVQATLAAETTKVIGVVRSSDGAGNLLTSNSTATSGKFGLDSNILSILGTAPTTAGKLDVKGADGDVFVRQTTGSNLHTVLDSGTLTTLTTLTGTTTLTPGTGATNLGKAEDAAHASGDTGVAVWGVRNDNLATTYGNDQDYGPLATDLNGRVMVAQKAATATLSNVSTSGTSAILLSANSSRIGATITNEATTVLYVKFGATASTASYIVVLAGAASAPYSYYEVPAGYTGRIDGILASSTGTARMNEMT